MEYKDALRMLENTAIEYARKTSSENLRALAKAATQLNDAVEAIRKQQTKPLVSKLRKK